MKFSVLKTKIEISFLFIALLSLVILTDTTGLIIPTVIAVTLHEFSHLLAMNYFGCSPKKIKIIPAAIEITRDFCQKNSQEIIISLAGSVANILTFLITYFFLFKGKNMFFLNFAGVNFVIGFFNLLPLKSLDGGNILFKILCFKFSTEKSERILNIINFIIGLAGIFVGIFLIINGKINFSVIIMSIYIILTVIIKL
ncbi:MAG: site-2 protease family protein [Clostridia bacterium]|nr:site-2 protease family protein [Clostridia bacterium]